MPEQDFSQYARITSSVLGSAATGVTLGLAASGQSLAAAAGATAPLTLGIGAAVAGIVALVSSFFGPSPWNVPSAQMEQTFELGVLNLEQLVKDGMITVAQAVAGSNIFLQVGTQQFTKAIQGGYGKSGEQGLSNMTTVINQIIARMQSTLKDNVTQEIDLSAARASYAKAAALKTFYGVSTEAANQITDQYLSTLPKNSTIGSIEGVIGTASSTLQQVANDLGLGTLFGNPNPAPAPYTPGTPAPAPAPTTSPLLSLGLLGGALLLLKRIL